MLRCTVCGTETRIGTVPPAGHAPGDWQLVSTPDCSHRGLIAKVCTVCGEPAESIEIETSAHTPSAEYVTLKAPACTVDGEEALICTKCGEALSLRSVPATGHVPAKERVMMTLPSEDGSLCGCSCSVCSVCSAILDIIWLRSDGTVESASRAVTASRSVMNDIMCCRRDVASPDSLDYNSDGQFGVEDLLAIKKLSGNN